MHIKKLTLYTANLQETKLFYTQKLELPLLSETDDSIDLKAGSTILHFKTTTDASPFYHIAFTIAENMLEESTAFIRNKELAILPYEGNIHVDFPNWNAKSLYFHDNNDSILEFIVRYDLQYTAPLPFNAKAIASVSEIGIVVDDVTTVANRLKNDHHIPFFSKGPVRDDFTVMGDDHGLLLVCATGRGWLPTGQPAEKHPVVVIDTEDQEIRM